MAVERERDEDGVSTTATSQLAGRRGMAGNRGTGMALLMQVDRWDQRRDGPLTEAALQHKLKVLCYDPLPRSNPAGAIVSARVHHRQRTLNDPPGQSAALAQAPSTGRLTSDESGRLTRGEDAGRGPL